MQACFEELLARWRIVNEDATVIIAGLQANMSASERRRNIMERRKELLAQA